MRAASDKVGDPWRGRVIGAVSLRFYRFVRGTRCNATCIGLLYAQERVAAVLQIWGLSGPETGER